MHDADGNAAGRARLDRLIRALRAKQKGAPATTVARRPAAAGPAPLTAGQERLYLLHQLDPNAATYTIAGSVELEGPLEVATLHRALGDVVARHEPLRTTFAPTEAGDQPVQQVGDATVPPRLEIVELTGDAAREDAIDTRARDLAAAPFDLASGPLLRATLLRADDGRQRLVLALHHLIADGWSLGILVRELAEAYDRRLAGQEATGPELPVRFGDFAAWQRERADRPAVRESLERAVARLADCPVLELPTDRPRPTTARYEGAILDSTLDAAAVNGLEALGSRSGATLFMVVLAAYACLLGRVSRQRDVVIGTPHAGRGQQELEGLVGFFVDNLVIRLDLTGRPTFDDLVRRATDAMLAAEADSDAPFEILASRLGANRDPSVSPLFQAMLTVERDPPAAIEGGRVRFVPHPIDLGISKLDITLAVTVDGERSGARWVYKTGLFDAATIARLDRALVSLVQAAIADPARPADTLPLQAPDVRRRLLDVASREAESYPPAGTLHGMVRAQAERTPHRVALEQDGATLDYAALVARADHLAQRLRRAGVGPGAVVGIAMERSFHLVEALLGVLEAGGAYLPLDPQLPAARLELMLDDAAVSVVVVDAAIARDAGTADRVGARLARGGRRLMVHGPDAADRASAAPVATMAGADTEDVAYVIYTSGSTGRPKGVAVSHRAIANRLAWVRAIDLDDDVRFLHKTTISFDVSVAEIFAPLVCGGRVVLARPGGQRDTAYLVRLIADAGITDTSFPPALLRLLLDDPAFTAADRLRTVITGGEAVPADLVRTFAERMPGVAIENRYGPTEATVSVTRWVGPAGLKHGPVPIGRPIAGAEVYVLDEHLEPVPAGVAGELYLGGPCLAHGYLGRPARTAMSFVPHPFARQLGERFYKTGDLVRMHADGHLVFAGRVDEQVKIRGFRVELGEIESVLLAHGGVREAAVVDLPDGDTRRLAAYVATRSNGAPAPDDRELAAWVAARLPEHMVPAAFVRLDTLPTTPSGKVDRKALPAPDWRASSAPYEAPTTPTEHAVAAIWSTLLDVEEVGRADDFFALGGHSLLAGRALTRLRSQLEIEVPLRALFEHPTLAGFAARIDVLRAEAGASSALGTEPESDTDGLPELSFGQERLWFLHRLDPASAAYNIPGAVRLRGVLDQGALQRALDAVVARHDTLRTVFPADGGAPQRRVEPAEGVDLARADLGGDDRETARQRAEARARDEATRPFDLEAGPLFRALLLRIADDEHLLSVTMHHIVSDGWSVGLLVRDVGRAYAAALAEPKADAADLLPPLASTYLDWARADRAASRDPRAGRHLAFWRDTLAATPPVLLPADRPRPAMRSDRGATVPVRIPRALTEAAERFARDEGATLFMVLLAAFDALLARWSGATDLAVGTPVANRDDEDAEEIIGFFVNTLALRTDLTGDPTGRALIDRVKATVLAAFAHQATPFEQVVEAVQPDRDLASTPVFQTMLVLQNAPMGALGLPGLEAESVPVASGTAKVDVSLLLRRDDDGLVGALEFSTDVLETATAVRLRDHFATLLGGLVAAPDDRLSSLPLMDAGERATLARWNDTATADPPAPSLTSLLRAQAERTPDAVALVADDRTLTYGELDARAGCLAHTLVARGVGPEVLVGICAERSFEMMVGLVAILQAGGAYVPLDPAYPADRLAFMVDDAGAPVVLAQPHVRDRLGDLDGVAVIDLDPDVGRHGDALEPRPADADALAYMIYTSGSTGRPKGAMNSHRGIVNRLRWMQDAYRLTEDDRVLQKTPISFDVSVWELFWPLITGARLVLAPPEAHKDPDALACIVRNHGVTFLHFVPSMLQAFLAEPRVAKRCDSVRQIVCSGEALPYDLQERCFARLPHVRLDNLYGPTEAAVDVTAWSCVPGDDRRMVPIGSPIANVQTHVLDAEMRPQPIGIPGQLFLGGVQVARGYHRRPSLTALAFRPDPTASAPGARL